MPLRAPRGFIAEDDPKVAPIGHPAPPWLINYADLMTEMVAFFVIMYALGASLNKDVQKAKQDIQEMMKEEKIAGQVEVTKEGLRITMQEGGELGGDAPFFQSGKAELTSHMVEILGKLSPRLKGLAGKGHEMIVEGHTDNIPMNSTVYPTNWELSTARATVVVRHLIDSTEFPPTLIGGLGYGEHRPIAPNDSEFNRQKNRRVVFFIKNTPPKFKKQGEGEAPQSSTEGSQSE